MNKPETTTYFSLVLIHRQAVVNSTVLIGSRAERNNQSEVS